jgi:hypothetical protein
VRLAPLVNAVDGYLATMDGSEWPELKMPHIAQE